ncbi:MAG: TolC family protein [Gemmatimonadota bacterium]
MNIVTFPQDRSLTSRRRCQLTCVVAMLVAAGPLRAQEPREVSLDEALAIAIERNPQLDIARADRDAVGADRLGVWGSFLPSLRLNYGYQHSNVGRLDAIGQSITQTSHTLQLAGSYDLFTGFRRTSELRSSALQIDAQDAAVRKQEFDTRLQVKEAYYAAMAARDLARVEADRLQRQTDQLAFVREMVARGSATRSDELRSSVDLNNARLAVLTAENAVRQSSFQLAAAIGLEEPVAPEPEAEFDLEPVPWSREAFVERVVDSSPAATAARLFADVARVAVTSARSAYLPTLSMGLGQAWRNDEFPPEDNSWSLSLQASYPLFDGFDRESSVSRANAQARAAEAAARSVELDLRAQADDAYGQIDLASAGLALARETVELAREDLRVTEERYRLGLATILDLQSAQIALRQAEVDLVQRRFDYALGLARLESLLGTSLP